MSIDKHIDLTTDTFTNSSAYSQPAITGVTRRLAWQLYNREMYCRKDDINVICELLAVKHGDRELDLFGNSVLGAFIEILCTN